MWDDDIKGLCGVNERVGKVWTKCVQSAVPGTERTLGKWRMVPTIWLLLEGPPSPGPDSLVCKWRFNNNNRVKVKIATKGVFNRDFCLKRRTPIFFGMMKPWHGDVRERLWRPHAIK